MFAVFIVAFSSLIQYVGDDVSNFKMNFRQLHKLVRGFIADESGELSSKSQHVISSKPYGDLLIQSYNDYKRQADIQNLLKDCKKIEALQKEIYYDNCIALLKVASVLDLMESDFVKKLESLELVKRMLTASNTIKSLLIKARDLGTKYIDENLDKQLAAVQLMLKASIQEESNLDLTRATELQNLLNMLNNYQMHFFNSEDYRYTSNLPPYMKNVIAFSKKNIGKIGASLNRAVELFEASFDALPDSVYN